ncbi:MAG TPA: GGDEF domain-containing protein [Solirubrobacterales bacterium]|nr:GGDEF domain-containing protein [Solirubrobacterales bacterium]
MLEPPLGTALAVAVAFASTVEASLRRDRRRVLTLAFVGALGLGLLLGDGGLPLAQWSIYAVALIVVGEQVGTRAGQLRREALTDPLTGLLNRAGLHEAATRAAADCRRRGRRLTVVHLDLDDFKRVNDNFGHATGDRLLRGCAAGWSSLLGAEDVLARVGGDEFLLLLPGSDRAEAERLVERLRFRSPIGWSHGCAELTAADDFESCLLRADAALYAAKDRRDPQRLGADHRGRRHLTQLEERFPLARRVHA